MANIEAIVNKTMPYQNTNNLDKSTQNKPDKTKETQEQNQTLPNVVAVSKDGDTVQIDQDKQEQQNNMDKIVNTDQVVQNKNIMDNKTQLEEIRKAQEKKRLEEQQEKKELEDIELKKAKEEKKEKEIAEKRHQEMQEKVMGNDKDPTVKPTPTIFARYTEDQLEQMYLKGEISKQDYDAEIKAREEQKEQEKQNASDFSNEMTENINIKEQVQSTLNSIDTAYSPSASQTLTPQTRVDAIQSVQQAIFEPEV